MGQTWDSNKGGRKEWIAWLTDIMQQCYRVLKPGAHGVVWALPKTSHWTATALEDAGFEIRTIIHHHFAQGYPKGKNIGKALSLPQWNDWHSELKPTTEHWILVRKPLSEKTIAKNVLKWGVGGLNIGACRVKGAKAYTQEEWDKKGLARVTGNTYGTHGPSTSDLPDGRFAPALLLSHTPLCVPRGTKVVHGNAPFSRTDVTTVNDYGTYAVQSTVTHGMTEEVIDWDCHESCPCAIVNAQSGTLTSGTGAIHRKSAKGYTPHALGKESRAEGTPNITYGDSGEFSRYFPQFLEDSEDIEAELTLFSYFPKPSPKERNEGLEGLPKGQAGAYGEYAGDGRGRQTEHTPRENIHTTVKSKALMSWLCRLVTPPEGVILDCFLGSGTTAVAAALCGFSCIGIEKDATYMTIAQARLAHVTAQLEEAS